MKKKLLLALFMLFTMGSLQTAQANVLEDLASGPLKVLLNKEALKFFKLVSGSDSEVFANTEAMGSLNLSQDGRGFYVFGKYGPGARYWNTMNFWFPYETYSHKMYTSLSQSISLETLVNRLNSANTANNLHLAFWWDHQVGQLEQSIRDFAEAVGTENFAISMVYNLNTHGISFYVNVDSDASYSTIHNTTLIKVIKDNIRQVIAADPDAYPKQGDEISDSFHAHSGTPLVVLYILGTGELHFH